MMKLPNKIYSYRDSNISKFALILESIPNQGISVVELYFVKKILFVEIEEYIDVLTCLYALSIINVNNGVVTINK
ncbi:MAG: ABC-three component system middle component 7 [Bacteroidales bacterium]